MRRQTRDGWSLRYPPLISVCVSLALILLVLPSALNTPQSNPATTLEYAPVPPSDREAPPNTGNLSVLGLPQSAGVGEGPLPAGPEPSVLGKSPSTKHCVGHPPRQTEDLLSPPCVAYFEGDNGGATHSGVTPGEVRVAIYFDGGVSDGVTSRGSEERPVGTYVDLMKPARGDDHLMVRILRDYQRYFNIRYQAYERTVHLFAHFGADATSDAGTAPESRRADAAEEVKTLAPFATIAHIRDGNEDAFLERIAQRGVLNFGAAQSREASFYSRYPGLIWGFQASIDEQAKLFAGYVCREVVPFKTSFSGNAGQNGTPRKLGLLRTTDPEFPGLQLFAKIVRARVQACGGHFVAEGTFPTAGLRAYSPAPSSYATANMSSFQTKGVTTVIWAQGFENHMSTAASTINYHPEWITAGDSVSEGNDHGADQDQGVWDRAWIVTQKTYVGEDEDEPCVSSIHEVDADQPDAGFFCEFHGALYEDLRQLFTGIQVAGPRLSPSSIDRGFHAIPAVESNNKRVPACFYESGDYTCVKDGMTEWWDPNGVAPAGIHPRGCWRMADGGSRHFSTSWPKRDVARAKRSSDVCNEYNYGEYFGLY